MGVVVQTAQYFMTRAFQQDPSAKVSIIYYAGTVLAVAYGYFFFDEMISFWGFLGILLILFAVISQSLSRER